MRSLATDVAWSVCLCVCMLDTTVSPTKTAKPIEMPFGCALGWAQGTMFWVGPGSSQGNGKYWGLFSPSKCIFLRKQQKLQQHGAVHLFARDDCASRRKCGFITNSPAVHWSILCDPIQPNPSADWPNATQPTVSWKIWTQPDPNQYNYNGAYTLVVTYFHTQNLSRTFSQSNINLFMFFTDHYKNY